jgi:CRP-like cAMP-binding protein
MYILYKGNIRIIWGDESKGQYIEKGSGFSFGADALLDDAKRSATVIASSECECLIVLKPDFEKVIKDAEKLQKLETFKYLKAMDFFKKWTFEDLHAFSEKLKPLVFKPKENIYEQGENSNMIYIIYKGTLMMESTLDIDLFYKYPQGKNKWMATQMTRRVKHKVKELKEGDFFGHDEFTAGTKRTSSVYSFHESKIFYINIGENASMLDDAKAKQMLEAFPPTDFELLGQTIIQNFAIKKKYNNR